MRIRMQMHMRKKWIWIQVISLKFTEFLTKQNFHIFVLFFSLIFMQKLDEPFKNQEIFIISPWPYIYLSLEKFGLKFFNPPKKEEKSTILIIEKMVAVNVTQKESILQIFIKLVWYFRFLEEQI